MTTVQTWNPMILYISKNGKSLLNKENLRIIYDTEQKVKGLDKWK
jgi:hypothetical protein